MACRMNGAAKWECRLPNFPVWRWVKPRLAHFPTGCQGMAGWTIAEDVKGQVFPGLALSLAAEEKGMEKREQGPVGSEGCLG